MKNTASWPAISCMIVSVTPVEPTSAIVQGPSQVAIDWSERTAIDIRAAHEHMLENHPGPVDQAQPEFLTRAEKALSDSLEMAEKAESALEWQYSLMSYAAQFRDGHFIIRAEDPDQSPRPRWPGFLVAWRDDKVLVHDSDDDAAFPVGAEVVSCDGKAAKACILDQLFRFGGNPTTGGSWSLETPMLMFSDGNPFVHVPESIELRLSGSRTVERALTWKELAAEDNWYERRKQAVDGPRYPTSIKELPDGIWWIRLTDFQPDEADQARFDHVVEQIGKKLDSIRSSKAIVIDLRRNNGGSSFFPTKIAKLLWGEGHANWRESQTRKQTTYVEWRASPANLATLQSYVPMLEKQGWTEEELEGVYELIDGMSQAIARGSELYRQADEPTDFELQHSPPRIANPVDAPVYVIISGRCASASLDAIDIIKQFENVTLVGATTSADTNYMDIREFELPSGNATLSCPMKVYRNRKRGPGFAYLPDIKYDHVDWSDETFEPWLLSVIESQHNPK